MLLESLPREGTFKTQGPEPYIVGKWEVVRARRYRSSPQTYYINRKTGEIVDANGHLSE